MIGPPPLLCPTFLSFCYLFFSLCFGLLWGDCLILLSPALLLLSFPYSLLPFIAHWEYLFLDPFLFLFDPRRNILTDAILFF